MAQDDISNKKNMPRRPQHTQSANNVDSANSPHAPKAPAEGTAVHHSDRKPKLEAKPTIKPKIKPKTKPKTLQSPVVDDKTRVQPPPGSHSSQRQQAAHATSNAGNHRPEGDDNRTRLKPIQAKAAPKPKQASRAASEHIVLKHRFVLEKTVGVGGMGVVYKAKDLRKVEAKDRNPYVAVKILNEDFRRYPDAFIALQREARKSQSIAHPNIVNVHDFDRDGDTVFMTMEFMEGRPLDKLIQLNRANGLMFSQAMDILKGMCAALEHAHRENIIHSDFKPGNVFITKSGATKVFDFGIARAVATVDVHGHHPDNTAFNLKALQQVDKTLLHNDKSLFDPDTFGALTPAYASLEMLQGQSPSRQDDIYALAVVTYEMLSGQHPFQRLNAEEALARKLKPKRIRFLTRQQWRALKKGLAFKREHRTLTVHSFFTELTEVKKSLWKTPVAVTAALIISAGVYLEYFYQKEIDPDVLKTQLERQIKIDITKETIEEILKDASYDDFWHADLWKEVQYARKLLGSKDKWLIATESIIVDRYVNRARVKRLSVQLTEAQDLVAFAKKYRGNMSALDEEQMQLASALEEYRLKKRDAKAEKDRERERRRDLAANPQETKPRVEAVVKPNKPVVASSDKQTPRDVFALALTNVKQQLRCKNDLNTRNFEGAIRKLKSTDKKKYRAELPRLVSALAVCIEKIGADDSNRAEDLKLFALSLFPQNQVIAKIKIAPKDPCSKNKAGLGSRGQKGTCRDRLLNGGYGPRLVVIPATAGISEFAIGQFEVSIEQLNEYCRRSRKCKKMKSTDAELPVTNISVDMAKSYAKWLSRMTNYTYRIPRKKEWLHAAQALKGDLDDNRNCSVNSRGINKGENLEVITAGQKNNWGLVNHVGNAQEWVLVNNRKLVAMGGAHTDPIQQCQLTSQRSHGGEPDKITGFRLVREIR